MSKRGHVHPAGAVAPPPAQTLWSVQVMRGLAALMVVVGHGQSAVGAIATNAGGSFSRSTLVPWGAGVDLFFVISGFIMVHASRRLFGQAGARAEFLRRRLVRIVPLYWLVTSAFVALLAAATLKGGDSLLGIGSLAASYAFLPADTRGDGLLFPVYDLGWTLNYEMLFYALLALVIGWPRGRALVALGAMLGVSVAVGSFVLPGTALWFWTRPIVLDFGLGLAVGALLARGTVLPVAIRSVLVVAGLALLLLDPAHVFDGTTGGTVANAWPRVFVAGVPVAAILAGAVLGREPAMPRLAWPFGHLGDASYSLYLFHPFALILTEKLAQKLDAVRHAPGWLLVVATVATAILVGLAGHRWIERPLTAATARRFASPRLDRQACPPPPHRSITMSSLRRRLRRLVGQPSPFTPEPGLESIYRDLFRRELALLGEEDRFFPTGGAANYSLLYLILRIGTEFRPASVLDIGAGQSTLLWAMLRRHGLVGDVLTLENDAEWGARIGAQVDHNVLVTPLRTMRVGGREAMTYDWAAARADRRFDVIVCDGPRGTPRHSRSGVLTMLDGDLAPDFALILDDAERDGEQDTVDAVHRTLQSANVDYSVGVVRAAKTQAVFAAGRYVPATFL